MNISDKIKNDKEQCDIAGERYYYGHKSPAMIEQAARAFEEMKKPHGELPPEWVRKIGNEISAILLEDEG